MPNDTYTVPIKNRFQKNINLYRFSTPACNIFMFVGLIYKFFFNIRGFFIVLQKLYAFTESCN